MAYRPSSDKVLLFTVGFLTILGLVMVYSASSIHATARHGDSYHFFLRQLVFVGAGFLVLLGMMHVDYHIFQNPKVLKIIMILAATALVFVLTQPVRNGAHRWFSIKSISIQPSEFAKLAVLIFAAWFVYYYEKEINNPDRIAAICAAVAIFAVLIGVEPDMGQALTLVLVAAVLLVMAGLSWRYIAGAILVAIPVFFIFVYNVDYRWRRVEAFLHPEKDPSGAGHQITQSLIAVGSGGFFGLGLGGSQQKLFFLPEAHTDFIFAVICEELGLLFAALVVAAFLIFFFRGMKIALKSQDRFGFYLGTGITLLVTLQGFISISMVLAMLPTKGIALPFMSYGGSSLLMNMAATGILLNLSSQNKIAEAVE
jgi:cell division protein FtsW